MKALKLGKVLVFISESNQFNWAIHQRDRALSFRQQFITYLGMNNKRKLIEILREMEFEFYELRQAKRLPYKWEAKVYGMAWDDVRELATSLK
jgi:hypothetical protein